jgi:hypothetical protein
VKPLRKWLLWKTDEEMEDKRDLRYDEYVNCLIIMFSRKTLVLVRAMDINTIANF